MRNERDDAWVRVSKFVLPTSQTTRSTKLSYAPNMQRVFTTDSGLAHLGSGRRGDPRLAASPIVSCFVSNLLPQIRREPFLNGWHRFASACRVIHNLIASDLPDPEIFRIGMRKIEAADAGARMHRK
jgi:hypothetical protein